MRDDNDYAGMTLADLRVALCETSKQLAAWTSALSDAKATHARNFIECYADSHGKSVAERVKEAEMGSVTDLTILYDSEGNVEFHRSIRDLLVVLIENYV